MTHNGLPMSEAEQDDSFWVGTPEQIAETMIERRVMGFHRFIAEAAPFDEDGGRLTEDAFEQKTFRVVSRSGYGDAQAGQMGKPSVQTL